MVFVEVGWYDELEKRVKHQEKFIEKMKLVRADQDNEKDLRGLDSALKKTTSFIKKIKNLTSATIPAIIEDLNKLNLSKFVEEMASGITETKLKLSDIPKVSELCVEISARYSNFSEALVGEFKKMLPLKKSDKITNAAKLKIDILFLSDLVLCGVFNEKEGLQILGGVLSYLVQTDKTEFNNVSLISSICRYSGWQIAEVIPIPIDSSETREISNLPESTALTSTQKKSLRELLHGYYEALLKITETACVARNKALKKVKKQERVRGDAGDAEKQELEATQAVFDARKKLACELSAAIGIEMKQLKEEASDDEEDTAANIEMGRALAEGEVVLWTDEETRAFYENLINLRDVVPQSLYKESEQRTIEKTKTVQNIDEIDMENINENGASDNVSTNNAKEVEETRSRSPTITSETMGQQNGGGGAQNQWQNFVLDLDHLVSKYSVDQAAINFVSNFNKKGNHKKLINLMVSPPASRLDLIPFYARLIAILENVMPDLTTEIVNQTLEKFRGFMQKSGENVRIEVKLVTVAMIAELMKFDVISRAEGLSCLRQLVYNLRGHSVDMTAIMIELGGYYLYRHTDSHSKMKRLLEVVKVKRERMKDSRQIMLIDNAYFTCLPPEESKEERSRLQKNSEDTPMKKFIRHIIIDIDADFIDTFLKCLRRLDWSDPDISNYAIKYMSSPWLIPLENLQHLASAIVGLCGLSQFKWIGIAVIDNIIETIKISLEFPETFNQWANSAISYLGELYNFALCDEELVLKVLYLLITHPENEQSSWRDLSRLRLVCSLLQVAGEFLKTSAVANKFRYFMIYFDRFYLMKKEKFESEVEKLGLMGAIEDVESSINTKFPFEIEIAYENCSKVLRRVKSAIPIDLEAANLAVEKMENNLRKNIDVELQQQNSSDSRRGSFEEATIFEEDEEEYSDEDEEESDYDEEEEKLRFSEELKKQATKEEEDEFQRELDSLMGDGFRNPTTVQNVHEMSLPAAAKNRFERRIMFSDDTKEESSSANSQVRISMAHSEEEDEEERIRRENEKNSRVTIMMRGKGSKPQLKTVSIKDETLRERWEQEKEREKKEREDMKRLTLGQQRRIELEEEKAMMAQMNNYRIKGGAAIKKKY